MVRALVSTGGISPGTSPENGASSFIFTQVRFFNEVLQRFMLLYRDRYAQLVMFMAPLLSGQSLVKLMNSLLLCSQEPLRPGTETILESLNTFLWDSLLLVKSRLIDSVNCVVVTEESPGHESNSETFKEEESYA